MLFYYDIFAYGNRVLQPKHSMESHDLIGEFGGSVDSLPSDVSEAVARKERSKQSFLRVNLDWETSLGSQPS
jgi:hypothetical protein